MEMETAFITPMTRWGNIGNIGNMRDMGVQEDKKQQNSQVALFSDVFKTAINQVKETQADVEEKQYLLMTGQLDDAHSLPIAETKAEFTLDVLLTLRNKTLEAYNDLIKINI
jgi:flagellar hook-basal body complex protein FliE